MNSEGLSYLTNFFDSLQSVNEVAAPKQNIAWCFIRKRVSFKARGE